MKQAELGVDELNAKGGILGRKVELLVRDDSSSRRWAPSARRS